MRAQLEHLSEAEDRCEALIEQKIEIDGKLRELQERLEDEEELNNEMVIFKIDIIRAKFKLIFKIASIEKISYDSWHSYYILHLNVSLENIYEKFLGFEKTKT